MSQANEELKKKQEDLAVAFKLLLCQLCAIVCNAGDGRARSEGLLNMYKAFAEDASETGHSRKPCLPLPALDFQADVASQHAENQVQTSSWLGALTLHQEPLPGRSAFHSAQTAFRHFARQTRTHMPASHSIARVKHVRCQHVTGDP